MYCDGTSWTKIGGKTIPMAIGLQANSNTTSTSGNLVKVTLGATQSLNAPASTYSTSTSTITAGRAGVYAIQYSVRYFNIGAASTYEAVLYINGSAVYLTATYPPGAGNYPTVGAGVAQTLAVGDALTLYCRQYTGSNQTVSGTNVGIYETFIYAQEIPQW